MIRYALAGMATVAGLVLLFLGSFGSSPTPGSARDGSEKYASLQSSAPDETVDALREQLARARQDLAALEAQKQAASAAKTDHTAARAPTPSPTTSPRAPSTPAPNASAPKSADGGSAPARAAAAQKSAAATDDAAGRQQAAATQESTPSGAKPTTPSESGSPSSNAEAPANRQQARPAEPTQPFGFPRRNVEIRGAASAPRQAREDVTVASREPAPPASTPSASTQSASAPPTGAPSAADDVVERLRRQAIVTPTQRPSPPLPTALPQPFPAPRAGPHRIPTEDRLNDARLAVLEGRVEDARRFLQAAQVQLVFQPADSGDAPPPASLAAGPVGQALVALGYGDRGRALVAIDQAIGVLNGLGRLGSAPGQQADAGQPPLPLPTPRSWP